MSKNSPYISALGISMKRPQPRVIGWLGLTTHSRSRSAASRHVRLQVVPMRRLKIFE